MIARKMSDRVTALQAVDWNRRLFDALVPLPEGTSYNAYLVEGTEKTALLDTVDPAFAAPFLAALDGVPRVDYVVAHHAEQDHAGLLPQVLARYPEATLLCSAKARGMLRDLLPLPEERLRAVQDGESVDLGGRTLRFHPMPWVHWPETMVTWMPEERTLFSCDLFGSHLATSDLFADDAPRVRAAAKMYYAQIMMPYARVIRKHLEAVHALDPATIAPSHGPVHREPSAILEAYGAWLDERPSNLAVIPCVSMHGSTAAMTERLTDALTARGVGVQVFDLTSFALDRFATALVDAATWIAAAPVVWGDLHPLARMAALVTNGLKGKLRWAAVVGSYGWGGSALEPGPGLLPDAKVEWLPSVACRGAPKEADFAALDQLAEAVAARHRDAGLLA